MRYLLGSGYGFAPSLLLGLLLPPFFRKCGHAAVQISGHMILQGSAGRHIPATTFASEPTFQQNPATILAMVFGGSLKSIIGTSRSIVITIILSSIGSGYGFGLGGTHGIVNSYKALAITGNYTFILSLE